MNHAAAGAPGAPVDRYSRGAIYLHWAIAVLLLAQGVFGFALDDLAPRGTPARAGVINLHKSTGVLLGLLIVLRLGWRLRHRPPAWPASLPSWQRQAASLSHRLLYAGMVLLPLSGYLGSNFSPHGLRFFGHRWAPWGPDLPAVYAFFNGLHDLTAWAMTGLLLLHVAAAVQHRLLRHDAIWRRISLGRTP